MRVSSHTAHTQWLSILVVDRNWRTIGWRISRSLSKYCTSFVTKYFDGVKLGGQVTRRPFGRPLILNLGARWWLTPRPGRFIPAKDTRYPSSRRLGHQNRCGHFREEKSGVFYFVFWIPFLVLSLDFPCTCFFVLIVLGCAFVFTLRHKRTMPPAGFQPAISAFHLPQTLAWHRLATGIAIF